MTSQNRTLRWAASTMYSIADPSGPSAAASGCFPSAVIVSPFVGPPVPAVRVHERRVAAGLLISGYVFTSFDRLRASEVLSVESLEFAAACLAEIAQHVDRPAVDHLPQLDEGPVRLGIRIDDLFSYLLGCFDHARRRQDAHSGDLRVDPDQGGDIRLAVLQRVDVTFRSFLDELLVELLSRDFFLHEPLSTCLRPVSEPSGGPGCERADDGARQACEGGNDRGVHDAILATCLQLSSELLREFRHLVP